MSSTIHSNALRTFALAGFLGWASLSLPTTMRAQAESAASVSADSVTTRSRVLYRAHPFSPPGVMEYRSVPFGAPAPQNPKNRRVMAEVDEQRPLYYHPVPFGTQQVVEYRGDRFTTPGLRAWKDSRAARLAKRGAVKRAPAAAGGPD